MSGICATAIFINAIVCSAPFAFFIFLGTGFPDPPELRVKPLFHKFYERLSINTWLFIEWSDHPWKMVASEADNAVHHKFCCDDNQKKFHQAMSLLAQSR